MTLYFVQFTGEYLVIQKRGRNIDKKELGWSSESHKEGVREVKGRESGFRRA